MNDRERDLATTVGFLAVLCLALLVIIGINLPAIQGGEAPAQPVPHLQMPSDSCANPPYPTPCLENLK